jgi:hypothetical protein
MNELMKSNPSNLISLSIYYFYAFASFRKQNIQKPFESLYLKIY